MQELLEKIIRDLRCYNDGNAEKPFDGEYLSSAIRAANRGNTEVATHIGKRKLWPYLLQEKRAQTPFFSSLKLSDDELSQLETLLTTKPIRTASGVATVTVLTKPYPCSGECIFCPNDIRMPKSYMHNEPACQRAELLRFDPYLQVYKRLEVLQEMGHETGKVEVIVLGGTWTDYPENYRLWFVKRIFDALNDFDPDNENLNETSDEPENHFPKVSRDSNEQDFNVEVNAKAVTPLQDEIDKHELSYNQAYRLRYAEDDEARETLETATWEELEDAQKQNETAKTRCVGLVFETRPDKVNHKTLTELRRLGATKIQLGIQSTRNEILSQNARQITTEKIKEAFALTRLFGFKIHAHAMLNLLGTSLEEDKADYATLIQNKAYKPDEIKLYPCALVAGTQLEVEHEKGNWTPYKTDELVATLAEDVLITPPYARISRMIRDIPSIDILVGNKKTNLRQMVEEEAERQAYQRQTRIEEIRHREIHKDQPPSCGMSVVRYQTNVADERFIQFSTPDNQILGFCRLSLPFRHETQNSEEPPVKASILHDTTASDGRAMIRELHVYGTSVSVGESSSNAQHRGLGKALLQEAEREAAAEGFEKIRVISAVGTREYYRGLGYVDAELYLEKTLDENS